MVETNLLGTVSATHAFVEDLCAGSGDAVTISTVARRAARAVSRIDAATTCGAPGFSDAMRQELLGDDVGVVCVESGAAATDVPDRSSHAQTRQATRASYHVELESPLAAGDSASLSLTAVCAPERASITEVLLRAIRQLDPSPGRCRGRRVHGRRHCGPGSRPGPLHGGTTPDRRHVSLARTLLRIGRLAPRMI